MQISRLTPLLALLAGTILAPARSLSPQEALARVENQLPHRAAAFKPAQARLLRAFTSSDNTPAVYLFGQGSQCLVVAADDQVTPLLGYCDAPMEGAQLPAAFEEYLDEMATEAAYAVTAGLQNGVLPPVGSAVQPLLTCEWGQNWPYNLYTPTVWGQQTPTGCVATALAQIMKYWQWPPVTTGTEGIISADGTKYTMSLDGQPIDWSKMLDHYGDDASAESCHEVANLLKLLGYGVKMTYRPGASSAFSEDVAACMHQTFDYSQYVKGVRRSKISRAQWEEQLYSQLSRGIPVYNSGVSSSGTGHAFVCDGYDGQGYFHYNWGWDGMCNGYFLTSCLVPAGVGTGGDIGGYTYDQYAVFNIYPPGTYIEEPECCIAEKGREFNGWPAYFKFSLETNFPATEAEYFLKIREDGRENENCFPLEEYDNWAYGYTFNTSGNCRLESDKTYYAEIVWRMRGETDYRAPLRRWNFYCIKENDYDIWCYDYLGEEVPDEACIFLQVDDITVNSGHTYILGQPNHISVKIRNLTDDYCFCRGKINFEAHDAYEFKERIAIELKPLEETVLQLPCMANGLYDDASLAGERTVRVVSFDNVTKIEMTNPGQKFYAAHESVTPFHDDGTLKYMITPYGESVVYGTSGNGLLSGDIVFPNQIQVEDKVLPVTGLSADWRSWLSHANVTSLVFNTPVQTISAGSASDFSKNLSALKKLWLPETVKSIGSYAFHGAVSLTDLKLPAKLDNLGFCAFAWLQSLTEFQLPVAKVYQDECFSQHAFSRIVIPEGVEEIGQAAFWTYATNLSYVELPSTLKVIGSRAFRNENYQTGNLQDVKCHAEIPPVMGEACFSAGDFKSATLHVPLGTVGAYRAAPGWSNFDRITDGTSEAELVKAASEENLQGWYTLQGVALRAQPTVPGVYIRKTSEGSRLQQIR